MFGLSRRGEQRVAPVMLALLAMPFAGCESPARTAEQDREVRQALLAELQPVTLQNCTLARLGSAHDGGYLVCKNLLEEVESGYSYGVGPNDEFGCEISSRYLIPVHQYHCFDIPPVCPLGLFVFHDKCIGPRTRKADSRSFETLTNQIAKNGDTGKRLIVKMDIEGAEWASLMETPTEVLETIDQLPMELHGVNERQFLEVLQKLKRTFHLVNVHFNNFACTPDAAPLPSWAYQVLFVNKRIGILDPAAPVPALASTLNARDNPSADDCQLDEPQRAARERQVRESLLKEIQPIALKNCKLTRVGSRNDGGYVMCENLIEYLGAGYSYGVGPNDDWGCQLSKRYRVPVRQDRLLRADEASLPGRKFRLSQRVHRRSQGDDLRAAVRHARESDSRERRRRQASYREDRHRGCRVGRTDGDARISPRANRSDADGASRRQRTTIRGGGAEAQTHLLLRQSPFQ